MTRQKVDIGAISIAEISDQYLKEIEHMEEMDLDIASDFLVVASTLLQIKAASLIPVNDEDEDDILDDEFENLSADETRNILVNRLAKYKQFKNVASALNSRYESQELMHPRHASLQPEFLGLMPDYLKGVTLHSLAVICAELAMRRDTFLLEAEHIAAVPISMERHVEGIYNTIKDKKHKTFNELIGNDPTPELVVVTFLAVLELFKRGVISIHQDDSFSDMDLNMEDDAPEINDFSVPDFSAPIEDEDKSSLNSVIPKLEE